MEIMRLPSVNAIGDGVMSTDTAGTVPNGTADRPLCMTESNTPIAISESYSPIHTTVWRRCSLVSFSISHGLGGLGFASKTACKYPVQSNIDSFTYANHCHNRSSPSRLQSARHPVLIYTAIRSIASRSAVY